MKDSSESTYFVNVNCNGITGKQHIYSKFDYEVIDDMYKTCDENENPVVYNLLYKLTLTVPKNKVVITLSPDPSISSATIAGLAEKYMCGQINGTPNTPSLKIIYLTSVPHLLTKYKEPTIENFRNSIISNLLGATSCSYTGHKLALDCNQFYLLGINDNLLEDDEKEVLDNSGITYFTLNQMRKKGISNVIEYINNSIMCDPVMVVFDMASTSYETAPCVTRFLKDGIRTKIKDLNGLQTSELVDIFSKINKNNLVGLDITSFDFRIDNKERAYRISCEAARLPLAILLNIKEKKINIFNENSKFLIYRPMNQESVTDVGWYILRNIPIDTREEIIKYIENDTIITLQIDIDNDGNEQTVMITTTTLGEQEEKTFFSKDKKITDCILFPVEKTSAMFELLNTNENSLHV
jgi:arginase family enzyme